MASVDTVDLLDLKLLPAWVKEPADAGQYARYDGGPDEEMPSRRGRERRNRDRHPAKSKRRAEKRDRERLPFRQGVKDRQRKDRQENLQPALPEIAIRFLPHLPSLENVVTQIKSEPLAYSLFALARLFLEKPERYQVHFKTTQNAPLYQLGETGAISANREFLEQAAFRFAKEDFYKIEITESEPIKGNFTNVARCKLSCTLLGPTNHHSYQARLRNLYEQRFSRRMSFADYQRQIEIVSDPAAVEKWKEEARKVTTFTTLREEAPRTFSSAPEAEKHFRQTYLPGLIREVEEVTIGGALSRRLPDRALYRAIEQAWTRETRSPAPLMQELASKFREAGVHIFRHRRGMLFVSPIRVRALAHEGSALSPLVNAILETISASPSINRKALAEKLIVRPGESVLRRIDLPSDEVESRKLALASDLHWLVREGYVIEFSDGSLDLPRSKKSTQPETIDSMSGERSAEAAQSPTTLSAGSESAPS